MPEPNPRSERVLRVAPSVFLFVLMLAGLAYGFYHFFGEHPEKPPVVSTLGPTITQVEKLGLLTVMKVSISDVLTMTGYNFKGAWLVKGDALITVDMRKLQISDRSEADKLVTITLPEPEVYQPRVDQTKTMTYDVAGDWFTLIPGWGNESKLRDAAMLEAQKLVEFAVHQPEYIKQAKSNAELVLQNILGFSGWYVRIQWASDVAKEESASGVKSQPGETLPPSTSAERPVSRR
jgi:hypothetical protein